MDRAFFRRFNRNISAFPDIFIYGGGRTSQQIYSTTTHELAHASQFDLSNSNFRKIDDIIIESWAVAISHFMVVAEYGTDVFDWQNETFNRINTTFEGVYTPLIIDLVDNVDQRATHGGSTNFPIDRVSGYTLGQIEGALKVDSYNAFRDNLRNRYVNITEGNLNELFANYR